VKPAKLNRWRICEEGVEMKEENAEELIHCLNVGVHTSKYVFDDKGAFAGTQPCMHVGHSSGGLILMHGTDVRVREFIPQRSQRFVPVSPFDRDK
jgi:hypothetical protein